MTVSATSPDAAYTYPTTDSYGYQEIGGNGTYNPNLAADGTDLTNAAFSGVSQCGTPGHINNGYVASQVGGVLQTTYSPTVVGEYHSNWNEYGWLTYDKGASAMIGILAGVDGKAFSISGYDRVTNGSSLGETMGNLGYYDSKQVTARMKYQMTKWDLRDANTGALCYWWYQWDEHGIYAYPNGQDPIEYGANINNAQNAQQTVWRTDGLTAAKNIMFNHPQWRHWKHWGFNLCLLHNLGVTYGGAAQIGFVLPDGTTAYLG